MLLLYSWRKVSERQINFRLRQPPELIYRQLYSVFEAIGQHYSQAVKVEKLICTLVLHVHNMQMNCLNLACIIQQQLSFSNVVPDTFIMYMK